MPRLGIRAPGFRWSGFSIHFATLSGVLATKLAARLLRLPKCVRLGPIWPADTPVMVWQPTHVDCANRALPSWARGSVDSTGGACWFLTQASNSSLGWTTTRKRMLACDTPQYSAH